ncbi:hypothetical protein [Plastoroseomonas hellenica]|uniref:hypothetical protein n=1 Tax=Plastoroseomonas hellenica TaxID=2687306 RepID=UPI001BAC6A8C|nr:hypothetical protein [Plastoroseomonas hellenica]MBR0643877.1 hypothetical protein [Plastoroseomonas hellenica]
MTTRDVIRRLKSAPVSRRTADAAIVLIEKLQAEVARLKAQVEVRDRPPEDPPQKPDDAVISAEDAIVKADRRQQTK